MKRNVRALFLVITLTVQVSGMDQSAQELEQGLFAAVKGCDENEVNALLQKHTRAEITQCINKTDRSHRNHVAQRTLLYHAIKRVGYAVDKIKGQSDPQPAMCIVKALLEAGADANAPSVTCKSAIPLNLPAWACKDMGLVSKRSPLTQCTKFDCPMVQEQVAKLLVKHGARCRMPELRRALETNRPEMVKAVLMDTNVDVGEINEPDWRYPDESTALQLAIKDSPDSIDVLLEAGANPNRLRLDGSFSPYFHSPWYDAIRYKKDKAYAYRLATLFLKRYPDASQIAYQDREKTLSVEQVAQQHRRAIYKLIQDRRLIQTVYMQKKRLALRAFYEKDENDGQYYAKSGLPKEIRSKIGSLLSAEQEWHYYVAQPEDKKQKLRKKYERMLCNVPSRRTFSAAVAFPQCNTWSQWCSFKMRELYAAYDAYLKDRRNRWFLKHMPVLPRLSGWIYAFAWSVL